MMLLSRTKGGPVNNTAVIVDRPHDRVSKAAVLHRTNYKNAAWAPGKPAHHVVGLARLPFRKARLALGAAIDAEGLASQLGALFNSLGSPAQRFGGSVNWGLQLSSLEASGLDEELGAGCQSLELVFVGTAHPNSEHADASGFGSADLLPAFVGIAEIAIGDEHQSFGVGTALGI